jgi:hypothetical protein
MEGSFNDAPTFYQQLEGVTQKLLHPLFFKYTWALDYLQIKIIHWINPLTNKYRQFAFVSN